MYETSNTDKRDIVSNLKKELEKKTDEILDLNDRLVGLQQAKDAEKEAFDKQLTDLRTEFQETKDMLTNQNNSLCTFKVFSLFLLLILPYLYKNFGYYY